MKEECGSLCLTVSGDDQIKIGDDIIVRVRKRSGKNEYRVRIIAPKNIAVVRIDAGPDSPEEDNYGNY